MIDNPVAIHIGNDEFTCGGLRVGPSAARRTHQVERATESARSTIKVPRT